MKLLTGFRNKCAKWGFAAEELREYTGPVKNPARGWYQLHTFQIEDEPDMYELEWCIDGNDSLAMIVIDIGSSRERDLNETETGRIRSILKFFADNRYDVILRVVYDHEGKAMEREPFAFAQVLRHVEQLGGIIREFEDTIFVCQGLLIGNWGEMHSSKFLKHEQLIQLADALMRQKGEKTFLAVRKPVYWRILHEKGAGTDGEREERTGLFDDGIFGSESNLGTFGDKPGPEAGWTNAWTREEELAFEEKLCKSVPNGGEAVFGDGYTEGLCLKDILLVLNRMHITYLNKMHDMRLIDMWKNAKISAAGVWKGRSVYEYIGAHLGYRFCIKRVSASLPCRADDKLCRIDIEIENRGFANIYEEVLLVLEWGEDALEKSHGGILSADMRSWDSGGTYRVSCTVELRDGPLYIYAERKRDGAPIYFANISGEGGRVLLGRFERKR